MDVPGQLILRNLNVVGGKPVAIQFPTHIIDAGLGQHDRSRFRLYIAERLFDGYEGGIIGIFRIDGGIKHTPNALSAGT